MVILEIILLLTGLVISIITLRKEKSASNFDKPLAWLYILVCLVSIVVIVIQNSNDKNSNIKLFKTLGSIEGTVHMQADSIQALLQKTISLNEKLDSINKKTEQAIYQREITNKEFTKQNELLAKANELTLKQLIEDRPIIQVFSYDLSFIAQDSLTFLRIGFSNTGHRIASRFRHLELLVFHNSNRRQYISHWISRSDTLNRTIHQNHPVVAREPIFSSFSILKENLNGALLLSSVLYYDELLRKEVYQDFLFQIETTNDQIIFNLEKESNRKDLETYMKNNKIEILNKK